MPRPRTTTDEVLAMEPFLALFNHLALPQRLPQREDARLDEIETSLLDHLIKSARLMRDVPRNSGNSDGHQTEYNLSISNAWASVMRCLVAAKTTHSGQRLNRTRLLSEFEAFTNATDVLVVHIHTQNAAILLHRLGE